MPSINDKVVVGFKDVRGRLLGLPPRVATNVVRRAVYAGAVLIRDKARGNAPVDTGALRASIVARANKSPKGEITASVGVARKTYAKGKRKGKSPRRYAHLAEFGSVRSKGKPYLRPALDSNIDAVLDEMVRKMVAGIDVEVLKLGGRSR